MNWRQTCPIVLFMAACGGNPGAVGGLPDAAKIGVLGVSTIPPARNLGLIPEVRETFESQAVGAFPANWALVPSVVGRNYDAIWRVFDLGPPMGKVVTATTLYNNLGTQALSHLAWVGTTPNLAGGVIPPDSHYYVETLLHMKEDSTYYANEHTLQALVQDNYNIEILIWSTGDVGQYWGLRLYSNDSLHPQSGQVIADWGEPARQITRSTGQTGWDWWGRVGIEIDLPKAEVSVYYNGQLVIPPRVVSTITTHALTSGLPIRADVRAVNNYMDADDFRIYLLGGSAERERSKYPEEVAP